MVKLTYLSLKKTTFLFRIFDISHCIFTQISIERARWMRNLILHPTSTHTKYFYGPHYPKNKKYLKKHDDDVIIMFFQVFLFLGQWGQSKVCRVGTHWMWNLIIHPRRSHARNLSKNTGIYVENTNKKVVFFILTPKLITIILIFSLKGPFQTSNFL